MTKYYQFKQRLALEFLENFTFYLNTVGILKTTRLQCSRPKTVPSAVPYRINRTNRTESSKF
ncbi:hypothetical protein BpHYR1_044819 [Brachionus plicatilis]|uniref:Uncharacterized protein n=1 Tax=Brachionus plicatilis TaxID=10195 RepID=A0A3M7QHI8_BRAPC|nr:hypothetical protein BpHYR1_044819 [Brachionus plicatilis]